MDRATIERNLAQVERDLRAASEDIVQQQETLKDLTRHGEDTTEAVRSISILEQTHLVFSSLRDHLADELAALDLACMPSETESLAVQILVRALSDALDGRPMQWRMIEHLDGATAVSSSSLPRVDGYRLKAGTSH
jgi:hypothetical protein